MSKHKLAVVLACLLAGASVTAAARGGGGGGGSPGGMSAGHMSAAGMANTNGPDAADRDKGLDRAEDRMSATGASHEQATDEQKVQQTKAKGKHHRPQAPLVEQQR